MQPIPDLAIPEVKPAFELYRGTLRQKVSGEYTHAHFQGALAKILEDWGKDRGRVGIEWRFYFLERDGTPSSSLVPDVAYLSFERLPRHPREAAEQPTIAPDIAVDILSPDDRVSDVLEKIDLYLAYGTPCVILVDPQQETVTIYFPENRTPRVFGSFETAVAIEGLTIDLSALFAARQVERNT